MRSEFYGFSGPTFLYVCISTEEITPRTSDIKSIQIATFPPLLSRRAPHKDARSAVGLAAHLP